MSSQPQLPRYLLIAAAGLGAVAVGAGVSCLRERGPLVVDGGSKGISASAMPDASTGPAPVLVTRLVATDLAPVLKEPGKSSRPLELLPRGFVVTVVRPYRDLAWAHDGIERRGALLEVRRSTLDGTSYMFASDLGEPVELPEAASLCAATPGAAAGCVDRMRRLALDGALIAWDGCQQARCAVARRTGDDTAAITLDGLMLLAPLTVGVGPQARTVAMATLHRNPENGISEEEVVLLPLHGPLRPLARVIVDHIDSRSEVVTRRQGKVVVEGGRPIFRGTERRQRASDGVEIGLRKLEEPIPLSD